MKLFAMKRRDGCVFVRVPGLRYSRAGYLATLELFGATVYRRTGDVRVAGAFGWIVYRNVCGARSFRWVREVPAEELVSGQ